MKTMKKWFLILAVLAFCVSLAAIIAHAAEPPYYVAGNDRLCGSHWDACDSANEMEYIGNGYYCKVYENVPAGIYEFKVTDGSWENTWGDGTGDSGNCRILVEKDGSTVTVWFSSNDGIVSYDGARPLPENYPKDYYVAGPPTLCHYANWQPMSSKNQMTLGGDGVYTKVYTDVPADSYEIKVTDGTWYNCWGAADSDENYGFTVDTNGSTVTVYFDPISKLVNAEIVFPDGGCAHQYDSVVTPPCCVMEGQTTYTCRLCGHKYYGDFKGLGDHLYEAYETTPGCLGDSNVYYCLYCSDSYIGNEGHAYELSETIHGCRSDRKVFTCTNCGASYTVSDSLFEHQYNKVVTLPTKDAQGYTTYTCKYCGYTYIGKYTQYQIFASGTCGEKLNWTLGNDRILTISGTGKMVINSRDDSWHWCTGRIEKVVIEPGVTTIDDNAFQDCWLVNSLVIPNTVTHIGSYAFLDCQNLTEVTIPDSVTSIGISVFDHCVDLTDVYYAGSQSDWEAIQVADGNDILLSTNIHFAMLDKPAISKLENVSNGVKLTWKHVAGAEKYKLVVKTATSAWKTIGYTSGTSFTWPRATSGVTYTFGICCFTADGKTATSAFDSKGKTIKYVAMPTIATAESAKDGVKLTWNAVPGAEKYKLMVKTDSGWKTIWNTVKTTYTWPDAQSGETYTFTIRCTTADGKTFTSAFDSTGKTVQYIARPCIKKLQNTANGVWINWDAVPGAVKYKIVVKTATSGWKTLGYSTGTSFTWPRATSGVTYTFGICCFTADGKTATSAFDSTGKTIKFVAQPAIAKLENTADGIKITWNKVPGAEKYKLMVKTDSGWNTIWNTVKTSYTWTGAESGKTYTFAIRCTTADGKTFTSAFDSAGETIKYVALPAIANLESTKDGIKITWNKVAGAEKYKLVVKTDSGWKTIWNTVNNSYVWTGAEKGKTYTFSIRCMTADGKTYTSAFNSAGWTHTYEPGMGDIFGGDNTDSGWGDIV